MKFGLLKEIIKMKVNYIFEITLRKDMIKELKKAYLEGRYEGIPVFSSFESFINQESKD